MTAPNDTSSIAAATATALDPRSKPAAPAHPGLNGWVEAGLFAIALAVLNVAYGVGHQIGAHPVVFVAYMMIIAAISLLALTGPGPDWKAIVRHPLSFAVGGGIIAMEAVYYLLISYASPADGSLLVRLNVPVAALMGFLLAGRKTSGLGILGHAIVFAAIAAYVPKLDPEHRWLAVTLGLTCGLIMTLRVFATEFHPWNQSAKTIPEKLRLTGLVLIVTSLMGAALLGGMLAAVEHGALPYADWMPRRADFLHTPTILLALFVGSLVLTTMQYLGFSAVLKIKAENFVATTAMIPLVTVAFQFAAIGLGILAPIAFNWAVLPPMLGVFAGVLLVIWAGRRHAGSINPKPAGKA